MRGSGRVPALLALLCVVACASASGVRIRSDRNPAADFGRYRRYAWASAPFGGGQWPARNDRTAFDWRVRELVDQELARRGYVRGSPADILVDYNIDTREKEMSDTLGEYARYRAAGGDGALSDVWVQGYSEGTLVVEVSDAATRALVWYGSATAVVNPSMREQRLPDAMQRIFAQFPAAPR
jgi:hypothetical protein